MEYRSSNAAGWTHHQGDLVSNVASAHGVHLTGASTGGVVTAAGDDANVSLRIVPKGAGILFLGNSSTPLSIGNGSTTGLFGLKRHLIQFTVPALSSGGSAESTLTLSGATTNSIFLVQPRSALNSSVAGVDLRVRSTLADEIVLTFANDSLSTLSGSTQSAYLLQFLF